MIDPGGSGVIYLSGCGITAPAGRPGTWRQSAGWCSTAEVLIEGPAKASPHPLPCTAKRECRVAIYSTYVRSAEGAPPDRNDEYYPLCDFYPSSSPCRAQARIRRESWPSSTAFPEKIRTKKRPMFVTAVAKARRATAGGRRALQEEDGARQPAVDGLRAKPARARPTTCGNISSTVEYRELATDLFHQAKYSPIAL